MWISEFADKKSANNEGHLYLRNTIVRYEMKLVTIEGE